MALGLTGTLPETLYLMTAQTTLFAGDELTGISLPTGFLTLKPSRERRPSCLTTEESLWAHRENRFPHLAHH